MKTRCPHQQQGALIFITPLLLSAIALMSVLVIDGARLFVLRADMQSQVNAAASAAADASQACGGTDVLLETMSQRALAAARTQGFIGDDGDLSVRAGLLEDSLTEPGQLAFRPTADFSRSNTALVSYSRSEPISRLLPKGMGNVTLETNAAVRKEVVATISAAGSGAEIGGGLLGALLGALLNQPGYSLHPLDLDSLGNTLFRVGDILGELGIDSLEGALPLGADQLAAALRNIAGASSPAGALADDLIGAAGIESVLVSDLISTVEDASVPGNTQVRAYDLLVSLALNIARQQQILSGAPLVVEGLNALDLPLDAVINKESLVLRLIVNRAPSLAIGPARKGPDGEWLTRFYAPDISLELKVDAKVLSGIELLGLVEFSLASLSIPLSVDLGGGTGALTSARCARGTENSVTFGVELDRKMATLGTGAIDPVNGDLLVRPLELDIGRLRLLLVTIDPAVGLSATIQGRVNGLSETVILDPSYPLFCDPTSGCTRLVYQDSGAGINSVALDVSINKLVLLGGISISGILDPLLRVLTDLLEEVTSSLLQAVVSPLAQALGVGFGGIQVSVEAANQDSIQLIENVPIQG